MRMATLLGSIALLLVNARTGLGGEVEGLAYDVKAIRKNVVSGGSAPHLRAIVRFRRELIAEMIASLQDGKTIPHFKAKAAYVLGQLRASEAVGPLCENLHVAPAVLLDKSFATRFPAQHALVLIGKPASREIVRRLQTETDPKNTVALCVVLQKIEGYEVAIFMLENEMSRVLDVEREKLKAATDHLKREREKEKEKETRGETDEPEAKAPPAALKKIRGEGEDER